MKSLFFLFSVLLAIISTTAFADTRRLKVGVLCRGSTTAQGAVDLINHELSGESDDVIISTPNPKNSSDPIYYRVRKPLKYVSAPTIIKTANQYEGPSVDFYIACVTVESQYIN